MESLSQLSVVFELMEVPYFELKPVYNDILLHFVYIKLYNVYEMFMRKNDKSLFEVDFRRLIKKNKLLNM